MIRRHYRPLAINILPEEYRKRYLTWREGALLAMLLVGLVALVFSLQRLSDQREKTSALRAEERRLTTAIRALAPQGPQAEQLRQEIARLQATLAKARKERGAILAPRFNWEALLPRVFVSLPRGIELTAIERTPGRLVIAGASYEGFSALEQYYNQLVGAPGVAKATVDRADLTDVDGADSYLLFNLTMTLAGD